MLMNLFIMNWFFSIMFLFMNHPLSLGCILLIQTIIMSLMSGFIYYNFWFSYILFLIMVGGMLIMFIYMTSIASNEKFKISKSTMILSIILLFFLILLSMKDNLYSNLTLININNWNQSKILMNISLNKFFNYPNIQMMVFLMIYLLITLIAVVKIIDKNWGTLRQK